MEKPAQTFLAHAGGGEGGENPRNSTGFLQRERTSSCSSEGCRQPEKLHSQRIHCSRCCYLLFSFYEVSMDSYK
ncbi:hypothetical protein QTO34_015814 [Cnephaeus nilssonii]|uniref:Uncharacterized protein n=1 Tax=Cnephaeus nilssonii TaxID=3371016 RepID=A0AA40I4S7_CNENI|nr:hypothetical protein QTO34_015814 [Eptesicus nilssonii]